MIAVIFRLLGGVGLFLLGMSLLSDGLKSFAGDALRRALVRFTGRPVKAFVSGALVTALVQSSSATTVAVIGFVSAGLLTFSQAVGLVIGASLGTTSTGWLVAVVGLKISIGTYALPLIGIGAFVKLVGHGRWRSLGLALAGFGLIFVGIETLQGGMEGLSGFFQLQQLPSGGLFGRLLMILVGLVMTVVMQSSSAAVATTLTALHSGSVQFEQAALLVIGAAIGTTVTGALAAIGASIPTRRTVLAHVSFNLATGMIAVTLLPLFLRAILWAQIHLGLDAGAASLAAFHTGFIVLGVALFLPFTERFAGWIEHLLPDKGVRLTEHLDSTLLSIPAVALEASRRALLETAGEFFIVIRDSLGPGLPVNDEDRLQQLEQALDQSQQFLATIPSVAGDEPLSQNRICQMHAVAHLARLRSYQLPPAVLRHQVVAEPLAEQRETLRELLHLCEAGLRGREESGWLTEAAARSEELTSGRRRGRPAVLARSATGGSDTTGALMLLDAMRWLDRVGHHAWRISHYLGSENARSFSPEDGAEVAE